MDLHTANSANPGLPPSSLASFLQAKASLIGGLIAEFDSQYTNPFFANPNDTLEGVDYGGIAAVAMLLAQTLHSLASSSGGTLLVNAHALMQAHVGLNAAGMSVLKTVPYLKAIWYLASSASE